MTIRKHIPNSITCMSLISGCVATVMAFEGNLFGALTWIIIAALFDFCDGFAARLLKAYSPMGKELDSLSDMVSFGVAPGIVLFHLLTTCVPSLPLGELGSYLPFLAFVIPTFSGLRLAKFNIDERQTTSFIGLPVPAHALFWGSVAYAVIMIAGSLALDVQIALPMVLIGAAAGCLVGFVLEFFLFGADYTRTEYLEYDDDDYYDDEYNDY